MKKEAAAAVSFFALKYDVNRKVHYAAIKS